MKNLFLLTLVVTLFASCSTPKYTYNFDHYDYSSGRKSVTAKPVETPLPAPDISTMTADVTIVPAEPLSKGDEAQLAEAKQALQKKYSDMSKSEKKEFRQEVKKEFKAYAKAVKKGEGVSSVAATSAMDHDLKLAIIFGAVGLTLTLFGGVNQAFWILGVISIVVGVVFLIKWLVRQ